MPPLRDRKEDIPQLVRHFLRDISSQYNRRPKEISDDAIDTLMRYAMARECPRIAQRHRARGNHESRPLQVSTVSTCRHWSIAKAQRRGFGEFSTLHQARAAYERDYILKKLDENHGNISRTAEVLGLERSHMYRKMKALGIAVKE